MEPPSGFEHGTPGLEIQHLNHLAIAIAQTNVALFYFQCETVFMKVRIGIKVSLYGRSNEKLSVTKPTGENMFKVNTIAKFESISHLVLVFLLLTFRR